MIAIEAAGLRKSFGSVQALDGLDLDGPRRAACAPCSARTAPARPPPSGSWPRSTRPDAGTARVGRARRGQRSRGGCARLIGLAGQHAAVDDDLTGRENLFILGLMHHLGRRGARARAAEPA